MSGLKHYLLCSIIGTSLAFSDDTPPAPTNKSSLYYAIFIATQKTVVKSQLSDIGDPVIRDNFLVIGDSANETINVTNALTFPRINIETGSTVNFTLEPTQEKTLILQGDGNVLLSGGGTINATGNSPDPHIVNGIFNINGAYGSGGAVNVVIHRDGIININSGASLNAQSLTYYLGDGDMALSSPTPLKTGTLNFLPGANNSSLHNSITVNKDDTLSDRDIIEKLHTLAPGSTIATLITGVDKVNGGNYVPNLSEDITSGLFDFGLQNTGVNLNLIMTNNKTPEFLAILAADQLDAANLMVKGSVTQTTETQGIIKPDPGAFHAKSLQLLNQIKLFAASIKRKCINIMHLSSGKHHGGMHGAQDAEPLVIPLKNSNSAVFFAPIYGQSQIRSTPLVTGASAHQLGLLGGFETSNSEAQQFFSIQGAVLVGHSLVSKGSRSSSFSKTGLLGVFFSQGFYQEAEWNTFANASFTYGHANRFTPNEMYQSRPKSRQFNISSELAYKFKFYGQDQDKSMLSFRPLAGLQYAHVESSAHTEKRTIGSGVGLTTLADQYNIVDAFTSLGVRRRFLFDNDVNCKLTAIAEYHRNLHRPSSMVRRIKLAMSAIPIAFKTNDSSKHKYMGSLTGSISQKDNNWKAFLKASFIKNGNTTTQQLMLTLNRKF